MDFVTFANTWLNTAKWTKFSDTEYLELYSLKSEVWSNSYSLVSFISFKDSLSSAFVSMGLKLFLNTFFQTAADCCAVLGGTHTFCKLLSLAIVFSVVVKKSLKNLPPPVFFLCQPLTVSCLVLCVNEQALLLPARVRRGEDGWHERLDAFTDHSWGRMKGEPLIFGFLSVSASCPPEESYHLKFCEYRTQKCCTLDWK